MSQQDHFTGLLMDWLEDQPASAPDQLLDSVLTDLKRTPQRGRWWASLRRFPVFHPSITRYAMALGAITLAAAVGLGLWRSGALDLIGSQCRLPNPPQEVRSTEIETDGPPGYVAFADCSFWVANTSSGTVQRIDPATNRVSATIRVAEPNRGPGGAAQAIASDGEQVWVAVRNPRQERKLVRIDPATNAVAQEFRVEFSAYNMVIVDGKAWLSDLEVESIGVYDLSTGERVKTIWVRGGPVQIDDGFGAVWGRSDDTIVRIDTETFEETRYSVPGRAIYVTVSETGVWSASPEGGIFKLSPETGEALLTIDSEPEPVRSAAAGGYVYVGSQFGNPDRTEVLQIDDETGQIVDRIGYSAAPWPETISAAGGSIWISDGTTATLVRIELPAGR